MTPPLQQVDRAEITIVVDNFVDLLLAPDESIDRFRAPSLDHEAALVAEHGFSALVTIERGGARTSVLYDAGLTPDAVGRNLDVLQVPVRDLRALVLSHGHADHHGGLEGLLRRHGRTGFPLIIHPEAWAERKIVFPTGGELSLPPPSRNDLDREGVDLLEDRGPTLLVDGAMLVSGQVDRVTDFETGFPIHFALRDGTWEPDPLILDDQNLIVNVRDRGLVIVSGCSHAGAVNVLRNAQQLTGEARIAGFIGGFHLGGGVFEQIIGPTVRAFANAGVECVLPAHCTGWKAVHELARTMPDAFVQPAVGTTVTF